MVNLAFGCLFIAIATLVLATPLILLWIKKTSKPWRSAVGLVEETALISVDESEPFIRIRYQFSIQGQPYWGQDEITIAPNESSTEILRKYPMGSEIQVDYHPDEPNLQSVIRQNDWGETSKVLLTWNLIQVVLFIVIFYAIGFALVRSGFGE